jgi:hypothetical protein
MDATPVKYASKKYAVAATGEIMMRRFTGRAE